jgi:ABC-type multidrug transport system ATPase subunit
MQEDLLYPNLTARETLRLFAAMRGVPQRNIEIVLEQKLKQFDMDKFADKLVSSLSGGMKRRVSLSLATLREPKICFL